MAGQAQNNNRADAIREAQKEQRAESGERGKTVIERSPTQDMIPELIK